MRSRFLAPLILPVVLLATSFSPIAQAAVNDRIAGSINSGSRVALPGMVVARAKHSTDLGLAPANKKLDSLSLHFSMTAAQQADLTQLLAAQLNPGSPSYHQWLTPEQFGARFGLVAPISRRSRRGSPARGSPSRALRAARLSSTSRARWRRRRLHLAPRFTACLITANSTSLTLPTRCSRRPSPVL